MAEATTDINGFVEIKDNKLSKPGVFDYLGSEIGGPEPDRVYKVYRPAEELQDPECIESFKLQPWVIDHKMLGKNYQAPAEEKGIHGVIGQDVYYDYDDNWLKGNIKIFSDTLEEEISDGKDELSLGFCCVYEFDNPGVFNGERYDVIQREIRGNHLASVDESRMDVAVMDSAMDHLTVKIERRGVNAMPAKKSVKTRVQKNPASTGQDQGEMSMSDMSMSDMANHLKDMMPMMKEMGEMMSYMKKMMDSMGGEGAMEEEYEDKESMEEEYKEDKESMEGEYAKDNYEDDKEDMDGMDKEEYENGNGRNGGMDQSANLAKEIKMLKAEIAEIKTAANAGMDSGAIMRELSDRDELARKLSQFVGTFDHSSKTLRQVAQYGVEKLEIPCSKGQEISALKAYMHNRNPKPEGLYAHTAQDSKTGSGNTLVNDYINGGKS